MANDDDPAQYPKSKDSPAGIPVADGDLDSRSGDRIGIYR